MSELNCTICDTQLSPAFEGKAEARDWDHSELVCHNCTDEFGSGFHLVPTA